MKNKGSVISLLFQSGSWRQIFPLLVLVVVLFAVLPVPCSYGVESGAMLESITFDRESTTRETITFKLNGPHIPKIFAMKGEAPKVVFDFYDTRHSPSIKGVIKSGGNLISAIRTGLHMDGQLKTRVVLDLVPASDYDFAQDFQSKNNTLVITIFHAQQKKNKSQGAQAGGKPKKADLVPVPAVTPPTVKKETASGTKEMEKRSEPVSGAPPAVAEKKPADSASSPLLIKTIAFEQSPDKGEKVVFQVNNFKPPVIFGIEEGTPSIVCDFFEAVVGEKVPEILLVQGKLVSQVRVEKKVDARKIRVVLELAPNHHYDLQQVFYKEENLYVLFVKSNDGAGAGGSGKP